MNLFAAPAQRFHSHRLFETIPRDQKAEGHLWLRVSSSAWRTTNSFLPHLPVQFLHSARINAPSRRRRGSSLSFTSEISICSVSVRMRSATTKPRTEANSRLHNNRILEYPPIFPLGFAEIKFRLHARRNVLAGANRSQEFSIRRQMRLRNGLNPPQFTISTPTAAREPEGRVFSLGASEVLI